MEEEGREAEWPRRWVEGWEAGPGDEWDDWAAKRQELCADAAKAGDPQPFGLRPPKSFREVASLLRGSDEWEAGKAFPLAAVFRESPCGRSAQSQRELCWLVELTPDTIQDLGLERGQTAWDACPKVAPFSSMHVLRYDGRTGRSFKRKPVLLKKTLDILHVSVAVLNHAGRLCRRIYSLRKRSEPGAEALLAGKYALYHLRYENLAAEPTKWNLRLGGRKVSLEVFVRTRPSFLAKSAEAVKELESLHQDPSSGSGASSVSGGEAGSSGMGTEQDVEGAGLGPPSSVAMSESEGEDGWLSDWERCWTWRPGLGDRWEGWAEKRKAVLRNAHFSGDPVPWGLVPPNDRSLIIQLLSGAWEAGKDFPLSAVAKESPLGRMLQLEMGGAWLVPINQDTILDLGLEKNKPIWDALPKIPRGVKSHYSVYEAVTGRALNNDPDAARASLKVLQLNYVILDHPGKLARRIYCLQERDEPGAPLRPTGFYALYVLAYEGWKAEPCRWDIRVKNGKSAPVPLHQAAFVRTRPSFLAKFAARVKERGGSLKMAWVESVAQGSGSGTGGEADEAMEGAKLGSLKQAWKRLRDSEGLPRLGTGGLPSPRSEDTAAKIRRRKERQPKSEGEGEEEENHEASDVMKLMQDDLDPPVQTIRSSLHASQSSATATDGFDKKDCLPREKEQNESVGSSESCGSSASSYRSGEAGSSGMGTDEDVEGTELGPPISVAMSESEGEDGWLSDWERCWTWRPGLGDRWEGWAEKRKAVLRSAQLSGDPVPWGLVPPKDRSLIIQLLEGKWEAGKDFPLSAVANETPLGLTLQEEMSLVWLIPITPDNVMDLGLEKSKGVWDALPRIPNGVKTHTRDYTADTARALKGDPDTAKSCLRLLHVVTARVDHPGNLFRNVYFLQERDEPGAPLRPSGTYALYAAAYQGWQAEPSKWSITLKRGRGPATTLAPASFVRTRPSFLRKAALEAKAAGSIKKGWGSTLVKSAAAAAGGSGSSSAPQPSSQNSTSSTSSSGGRASEEAPHTSKSSVFATNGLDKKDSLLSDEELSESLSFPESESGGPPESWAEEEPTASPFRPAAQGLPGTVAAQPGTKSQGTAPKVEAFFDASVQAPNCPLCEAKVPAEGLETHLRKELDYFPVRCSLCPAEFLDWPTAMAHFGGRFSLHRGVGPRLTEKRDAGKEQRLGELLDQAGL